MPAHPRHTLPRSGVNWLGLWTLYIKEVVRFLKVYNQTLVAPVVTALLFLAVFSLAMGERPQFVGDIAFHQFMIPGLIMMTVVQQAFANTSSTLIMGKVLGTIIDFLIPPISAGEMTFALVAGGVTRGVLVGVLVALAILPFQPLHVHDAWLALFYVVFASSMLSLLGILGSIFADSFDQMSALTNYIVTPLAFLSGTFYSVHHLPEFWRHVNVVNPLFYMIDGFRYSMTGHADADIATGIIVLIAANAALYALVQRLIARGYRIKS